MISDSYTCTHKIELITSERERQDDVMNDEVRPPRRRRRRYVRPSIDRTVDRWVGGAAAADIHQFGRVLVKQLIVAIVRVAQIAEAFLQVRQVASAEFVGRLR